jgi:predicted DNA-binding mobile mystery protein A
MNMKKKLIREQLQSSLLRFIDLRDTGRPHKGWIRAIRTALGMSGRQFAERMGVTKQWASDIEGREMTGSVTIKTMKRTAEALDCSFVYGFVPNTSLEDTVRARATLVATKRLAEASQTMALEAQSLSEEENHKVLSEMVEELVSNPPSNLWDAA